MSTIRFAPKLTTALKIALAAVGVLSLGLRARAQKSPEETLRTMTAGEGLEATLYASEPQFANPCDMDVDARGRVWITEGWNYRSSQLRPEGDRVVVLEDTDGDGKADKVHTFYQGKEINAALGICVLGDKVIVSASPNVYVFEDKDGDLKADGPPKVLFSGIGGPNNDHGLHTFVFGPDGRLYFNFGNAGGQVKTADGKPVIDLAGNEVSNRNRPYRQGMVFRCDPDGSNFETLAWNFRNNYEVCVDSFGTLWQSDNDDDGNRGVRINFVMEFGNYGYTQELTGAGWTEGWRRAQSRGVKEDEKPFYEWHQYDPGVVPNLLHTGAGSPCGICVYEGALLPPVFRNQLVHADAGPNVVRAYPAVADGAGYKATMVNILKNEKDRWFRPSDVCVAPDGSLMVCDWYDPGVGGHATGDKPRNPGDPVNVKGRVYRVAPPGAAYKVPPVDLSTPAGACAALASPNMAARYLGWSTLNKLQRAAEPELLKMWNGPDPRLRARALYLLARIEGAQEKYIRLALADREADLRVVALRIARQQKRDLLPLVAAVAEDPSPAVRREAAIALRGNKDPKAADLWAGLAARHAAGDRWYLEALGIGAYGNDDALLDAYLRKVGADRWNTPAGREVVWRLRAAKAPAMLARAILDKSTPPPEREKLFRAFDVVKSEARDDALVAIAADPSADTAVVIDALSRFKGMDAAKAARLKPRVAQVLEQCKGTATFVDLVEQFDLRERSADLLAYVAAHPTDTAAGAALKLVVRNDPAALEAAVAGPDGAKLTAALAASTDRSVTQLLQQIAADGRRGRPVREAAVTALARSKSGARAVLDLAARGRLPDDVRPLAASLLHNTSHKDVREEAAKLLPLPTARNDQQVPPIADLLKLKGNARRGPEVFVSATCSTCHLINGQGTSYGPELSEIGNKLSKEAIFTSVLYPNAGISQGYEGTIVTTADDEDLDGIVVSETADQIVLRRAGGINTTIGKADVKERRPMKLSIMPEGLMQQMTTQDLVDVVEYLSTLKKAQQAAK